MPHSIRAGRDSALIGAVAGLVLGCLALGPALSWGYVLLQDMVFVPGPAFSRFTFGLAGGAPRVVPSDAVVTALSAVLPGELVQKVILLGIFALGCSGVALLVPSRSAGLVAGVFYVWNPYVAERLLMGQWALLLGYAGLPWVVRAVWLGRRLWPALLPAAVGGFAAMTVTALVVAGLGIVRRSRDGSGGPPRDTVPTVPLGRTPLLVRMAPLLRMASLGRTALLVRMASLVRMAVPVVVLSLPWLVPALLRPTALAGDPVGVDAFAARADGPFGAVGSLLSLGGIWNAYAVPQGFGTPVAAAARLLLVLVGIAGFVLAARRRDQAVPYVQEALEPGGVPYVHGLGVPYGRGLGVLYGRGLGPAAAVGFGIAALGTTEAGRGVLRWLVGVWGGFAVFRDAQQFVAPLALLAAVGLGTLAASVPGTAWAGLLAVVPVAVLPSMAWGSAGAMGAVAYPAAWSAARETIRAEREPGDVLVLPFESYRRFPWNAGRAVLDPAQRYFAVPGRDVVAADTVRVGSMVVGSEDNRVSQLERVLEGSSPDLAAAGFRFVVVDAGAAAERERFDGWLKGATLLVDRSELRLYRIAGSMGRR